MKPLCTLRGDSESLWHPSSPQSNNTKEVFLLGFTFGTPELTLPQPSASGGVCWLMPNLPLAPLLLHVPACTHCVFVVPSVRLLIEATANRLGTVFSLIKLASHSLGGCVCPALATLTWRLLHLFPLPCRMAPFLVYIPLPLHSRQSQLSCTAECAN